MSVLFIALPIALLLGGSGLLACIYCIRAGQYDDLETPAIRILVDDSKAETLATDATDVTENTENTGR